MTRTAWVAAGFALLVVSTPRAQQPAADPLQPTNHPRLSADPSKLWMAPDTSALREPQGRAEHGRGASGGGARTGPLAQLAEAVKLEVDSNFAQALPILSQPAIQQGTLGHYAEYYRGLAELRLGRASDARQTFQTLQTKAPIGYLNEAASMREAESDEALGDQAAALAVYDRLSQAKTTAPDDVLMRLARAAKAVGRTDKATEAFSRVVYEFPFSDLASTAASELEVLPVAPIEPGTNRYKLEIGRAERLFGAKRYSQARPLYETLRRTAAIDDRELINLRLAECDYYLKRQRNARDGVRPYIDKASRQGEALFFYAVATRELGDDAEYMRTVRRIVAEFPDQSWAEEALNNLASHYIVRNDDEAADATFREMYEKYPTGHYAERAAWKIGWWAYKNGSYAETIRVFESAAAHFPRSDYRPSWLYWCGRAPQRRLIVDTPADDASLPDAPLPPNEHIVRALLGLELYDQAIDELHYAQKAWGDVPAIQATLAWIYNRRGDLRAGINAMKRAYPQYMAAGGEKLPTPLMKVLFPVNYWPLIRRYSEEHQLDPFMIAALIAQESTFTVDVRSAANAYGLMQLLPSTGRQYARSLRLPRRFSISMLTTAETNVRMGTALFADLVRQFGGAHYALASYNAGENRVARWISERPGIDQDEFIDDIPFPETQNYVKRIIGTAEDYRRLYGPEGRAGDDDAPVRQASASTAAKKPAARAPAKKHVKKPRHG